MEEPSNKISLKNESGGRADMDTPAPKPLSPAAARALAEKEERDRATAKTTPLPTEIKGRTGPEPTRYGDWEVKGIASDF